MIKMWLDTGWKLKNSRTGQCFDTRVPSSVYDTWLACGAMEDPYWRDNEDGALAMLEDDYEYTVTAAVSDEIMACDEVFLRFEGIDTAAEIYMNGNLLGHGDNMHRIWEYAVGALLKEENEIRVVIHSPIKYIARAYEAWGYDGAPEAMKGFVLLRKAHCSFGWDWGPRLPDAGIFRPVCLEGIQKARLDGVLIRQIHEKAGVTLTLEPEIRTVTEKDTLSYDVMIRCPDGDTKVITQSPKRVLIESPRLWWPNGYGEQPLYEITVVLKDGGHKVDCRSQRIGLRTMTVNTSKDQFGSQFAHQVNGVDIFAMGADYIPEDCIKARITPERTRQLLRHCKECNFNVIRVWGGGFYPDDSFYDICDELGLVVWQDFMFACGVYPLSPSFEETVRAEIAENIKRLRHHACLGLWCGNNEMEMFIEKNQWIRSSRQKTEYLVMNQYLIPKLVKQYDPDGFYWPSSPSSGGDFDGPNDADRGDAHYWEVWHGGVPFTQYRRHYFRYLSEFGFQSLPSMKTIESFTDEGDRNLFSYVMERHQKNNEANGKILGYLSQMYRYPTDFRGLIHASQLLQAEAIRYGVEHFRRNRGRCMGTVYWQLNDCWPVISWSSIDYCGRWKALQYFAKRFFASILLSCEEEGALGKNINEEDFHPLPGARLCITNETREDVYLTVKWSLRTNDSLVVREDRIKTQVSPLSAFWLPDLALEDMEPYHMYLAYELWQDNTMVSEGTSLFVPPKHFDFLDPGLILQVEGNEIIIASDGYAKGVEIGNEAEDLLLSDNYFDMNAGIKRIKVIQGSLQGLYVRSVYDIG